MSFRNLGAILPWLLGGLTSGLAIEVAAQSMPTREDGILNALCIHAADKPCPAGPAPTGLSPRQIVLDYHSANEMEPLDPHYVGNLAAALKRKELAGQCFEIHVEGAREATREYAIALTHRQAVRIAAVLDRHGVEKDRLATIGRSRPDTARTADTPPYRATLRTRLGPC